MLGSSVIHSQQIFLTLLGILGCGRTLALAGLLTIRGMETLSVRHRFLVVHPLGFPGRAHTSLPCQALQLQGFYPQRVF